MLQVIINSKKTRMAISSLMVAGGLNFINSQASFAETISVNRLDSGWYSQTGYHFPVNASYMAGDCRGPLGGCSFNNLPGEVDLGAELRDFFVFDVPTLNEPITSASLRLFIPNSSQYHGFGSVDGSESYQLSNVTTSISELLAGGGVGSERPDIFAALGTGTTYSDAFEITNDDLGTFVDIILNHDALEAINSEDILALSGLITTLDNTANDEYSFGYSNAAYGLIPEHPVQLILNTTTPEPSSLLGIVGLGIFGAICHKKRKK